MAHALLRGAAVAATGLLLMAAVGLGSSNPDGISYETGPPPTETSPPVAPSARPPPAEIAFTGFLMLPDPTGLVTGPRSLLWSESCQRLGVAEGLYTTAAADLTDGSTAGRLEDLDLYSYDAAGRRLAAADAESRGIGLHHTLALTPEVAHLLLCLAGGSHASFRVIVS